MVVPLVTFQVSAAESAGTLKPAVSSTGKSGERQAKGGKSPQGSSKEGVAGESNDEPVSGEGSVKPKSSGGSSEVDPGMTEVRIFMNLTKKAIDAGDFDLADKYLGAIAGVELPDPQKKVAMTEIAEAFEKKGEKVKAAAIYEKLCYLMENDLAASGWFMKLGFLYREMGSYQLAVARFYSVINLAIRSGGKNLDDNQTLSRAAQREIADTHFQKGDFEQAQKFYNMALRSSLNPEERALVLFRAGQCTMMRSDPGGAATIFERFLKDYPEHPNAAEVRYSLSQAFRAQGRPKEALETVMEFLSSASALKQKDPKSWVYWQKRAGNDFANDFYQHGDFINALTIYQKLALISKGQPDWHWPVVYQMGLCFERLRLESRARETYNYLVEQSNSPEVKGKKLPDSLETTVQMAVWRSEQLQWERGSSDALRGISGPEIRQLPKVR